MQVCQQCVQAAPCCSYCPSSPAALCQTVSASYSCPKAVTTYDACSGGTGSGNGGGSGGDTDGNGSNNIDSALSSSSGLASWKIAMIVVSVVLAALALARRCWVLRTRATQGMQATQHNAPTAHADVIPAPGLPFGQVVINPVFGDEEGRESVGGARRLTPSAPASPYSQY